MNKSRLPMFLIVFFLAAASVIAFQAFQRTTRAQGNRLSLYAGVGDLRKLEAQQAIPNPGNEAKVEIPTGMGELRRIESQQSSFIKDTAAGRYREVGMGDLQRFDAQVSAMLGGANPGKYAGMGDLHLFEALSEANSNDRED